MRQIKSMQQSCRDYRNFEVKPERNQYCVLKLFIRAGMNSEIFRTPIVLFALIILLDVRQIQRLTLMIRKRRMKVSGVARCAVFFAGSHVLSLRHVLWWQGGVKCGTIGESCPFAVRCVRETTKNRVPDEEVAL